MALKHGTGPWFCATCGTELKKLEQDGELCSKCASLANELRFRGEVGEAERLRIAAAIPTLTLPI